MNPDHRGMQGIRAIFFDYGGTLDAPGVAWLDRLYGYSTRIGYHVAFSRFRDAYIKAHRGLEREFPSHLDLEGVIRELIRRTLLSLGTSDWVLTNQLTRVFCRDSREHICRNLQVLARLKRLYRIGVISNGFGNLEGICRETGLIYGVDLMLDARTFGCTKPTRAIFMAALEAVGVAPEQALMVGNSLHKDVRGAIAAGMNAVWLVPPKVRKSAAKLDKDVMVISSLDELESLLLMQQAA